MRGEPWLWLTALVLGCRAPSPASAPEPVPSSGRNAPAGTPPGPSATAHADNGAPLTSVRSELPIPPSPAARPGEADAAARGDQAALLEAGRRVQDCFEANYTAVTVPSGELRLAVWLEVAPDGRVSAVRVDESGTNRDLRGGEFERCSLEALRHGRFGERPSERILELPFLLERIDAG